MPSKQTTPEGLLAEIEDLLRNLPSAYTLHVNGAEGARHLGRVIAVLTAWDSTRSESARLLANDIRHHPTYYDSRYDDLVQLLSEAQTDLRLNVVGPINTAIGSGMMFEYFDEIRKLIEAARSDLFFIDPYLDADFISRYLPAVAVSVSIRLLGREKMGKLIPAAKLMAQQRGSAVEVRSARIFMTATSSSMPVPAISPVHHSRMAA
jgi:hypothetical protein